MKLQNEKDVVELVKQDRWMMHVLNAAATGGSVPGLPAQKYGLHNFNHRTKLLDVNVIYFDKANLNESEEKKLERQLKNLLPDVPWSVKYEARMHLRNELPPYTPSADAISKFPETATALGLTLNKTGNVLLTAPHGIKDVIQLKVKPTPYFTKHQALARVCEQRIMQKDWPSIWNQ